MDLAFFHGALLDAFFSGALFFHVGLAELVDRREKSSPHLGDAEPLRSFRTEFIDSTSTHTWLCSAVTAVVLCFLSWVDFSQGAKIGIRPSPYNSSSRMTSEVCVCEETGEFLLVVVLFLPVFSKRFGRPV